MFALQATLQLIFASCLVVLLAQNAQGRQQLIKMYVYKHAEISESPYVVQLRHDNGEFFCAGALISPQHIVTAAECFDNIDFTKTVAVGAATKLTDVGVQRQIENVIKHPEYNCETKHSNAAVLKLKEPMESSSFKFVYVALANVPIADDAHPTTFGWRHFVTLKPEERGLYNVRYNLASKEDCKNKFNTSAESNVFCVVGDEYDGHYCVEDLGSPTVYRGKFVGIATSAQNCKTPKYLASYTSVYSIRSFIEEAMKVISDEDEL